MIQALEKLLQPWVQEAHPTQPLIFVINKYNRTLDTSVLIPISGSLFEKKEQNQCL
jgi:hypothetical protein